MPFFLVLKSRVTGNPVPFLLLIIFSWSVFFASVGYDDDLPQGHDSAFYLLLGKSFSLGHGYEDLSLPGEQNAFQAPSAMPLLLSFWWRTGLSLIWLKILLYLFMAGGACAVFLVFKEILGTKAALLVALSFSCTRYFILIANSTMTEVLFIPALYGGFYSAMKEERDGSDRRWGWLALVLLLILSRTRFTGLFFMGGYLVRRLQHKDFRKAAVGIACLTLWVIYEKSLLVPDKESASYLSGFSGTYPLFENPLGVLSELSRQIGKNTLLFIERLYGEILFRSAYYLLPPSGWLNKAMIPLSLVGAYGFIRLWRIRHFRWLILCTLLSLIPIMTWRSQGTLYRYLFPFFPWMAAAFLLPFYRLEPDTAVALKRYSFLLLCAIILFNQIGYTVRENQKGSFSPDVSARDLRTLHETIAGENNTNRMILSPCHFYTVLKTGAFSALSTFKMETCRGLSTFSQDRLEIIQAVERDRRPEMYSCGRGMALDADQPTVRSGQWGLYALRFDGR